MKARYFFILAAAVLAAGCAKELQSNEQELVPASGTTVLSIGIDDVKTHLGAADAQGAHKIFWSNGDKIAVNGVVSNALSGIEGDIQTASFSFESALSSPYSVLYPASVYDDANHINLPAVQDYDATGFADGMNPMAGYAVDGTISVQHLCAIVKVSVLRAASDPDTDNLVSVRFIGRNNEQVSGNFAIDYQNATLTGTSSAAADKVVKVVKRLATSTSGAAVYYIVVPAGVYSNGFDIKVQDANGHVMTKSKLVSKELEAGHLYDMTEFEFVPTTTELGVEISNANDLITFAQKFNAGEYDEDVIATVTADITFDATSSAEFNATNGIGRKKNVNGAAADNYFSGTFNGNGHTINGLTATVPVFAYTQTGSQIKNLTLDNTCTYTVASPSVDPNHGPLVGRNKGTIQNCTGNVNVVINNILDVNTVAQHYGGLVGRNYGGTIDGCTVAGDITCSQAGQTITQTQDDDGNDICAAYFGGIAGTQADNGSVNNCSFTGNITVHDGTTYGGITAKGVYFYVGGMVGYVENGVISDCVSGDSGNATAIDARGVFVPAVGGIAGWVKTAANTEVRGCDNYMSLSVASNGDRADTTPCRIGGIASRSAADIKDCANFGPISSSTNSTTLELGGIVADGVNVSDCVNNAAITRSNADRADDQANRYMYIGGIIGTFNTAGDIKDCHNSAGVTCNVIGISDKTTVDLGGIAGGGNKYQLDISGCINDGEVKLDNDYDAAVAIVRKAIGGILGNVSTAGTTVTECSNTGKVWGNNNAAGVCGPLSIGGTIGHTAASCTVTDCTNSGAILCNNLGNNINAYVDLGGIVGLAEAAITITGTSADATLNSGKVMVDGTGSAIVYARNTQGGILGYSKANDTKITYCKNTGEVNCTLNTNGKNRPAYTGGIVGILANLTYSSNAASKLGALTGLEIGNCNNTGKVYSADYSNTSGNKNSAFGGGIVGLVSATSEKPASIHDCTVSNCQVYVYRGTGGGVAAYANCCKFENISCAANMSGMNANVNGVGGIAGRLFDGSLSGCTFSGSISKVKCMGGLLYTMSDQNTDAGSSITNCKVDGATLTSGTGTAANGYTAAAVLVSVADAKANTITNTGVKGTLDGAAITLDSNMITTNGGATVSGTYLLD